jgi:hypothetical protein
MATQSHGNEMKANPGGQIGPKNVIGRDHLITQIWERLEQQCVVIDSVRRIGKSSVVQKMVAEPPPKWFPVYQDVEGIQSTDEFARNVHNIVQKFLSGTKRGLNFLQVLLEDTQTDTINFRGRHWTDILESAVRDTIKAEQNKQLVLFWDELPFMVENIRKSNGEQEAARVLDTLRSLRHQYPEIRMVYTGSIGLHHVLSKITAAKIPSRPTNDMYEIEVPPLTQDDAEDLAKRIIAGESLSCTDIDQAASTIAAEADCIPYYIHHIVLGLRLDSVAADPQQIREHVTRQLLAGNDPWDLAHYRQRIPIYYEDDAALVNMILDVLTGDDKVWNLITLLNAVNALSDAYDDRENLLRVLRLMERDHYLVRNTDNAYEFKFPLIRRWWKLDRGL